MNIAVAALPDRNHYLGNVYSAFRDAGLDVTFFDGLPNTEIEQYDLVHVHWPEALSNWKVPSEQGLIKIEAKLTEAKKVLCTRHNYQPHVLAGDTLQVLYDTVYSKAHAVIHMGRASLSDYFQKYPSIAPSQHHEVIPHPLYTTDYHLNISKKVARQRLNIPEKAKAVLVFGALRHQKESRFAHKVFDLVRTNHKHLIVANEKEPSYLHRRIPGKWKMFLLQGWIRRHLLSRTVNYEHIPDSLVPTYFSAADVVFIPRDNILNSGIPFLAWSLGKPTVGPRCGNLEESFIQMGQLSYEPRNPRSASSALQKALETLDMQGEGDVQSRAESLYSVHNVSLATARLITSIVQTGVP
jgi:hypothetical protein